MRVLAKLGGILVGERCYSGEVDMLTLTQLPTRHLIVGFAAGALFMVLLKIVGAAFAQTPPPVPAASMQQMFEWCRQMMSQAGTLMQGMMSGMCMMGR